VTAMSELERCSDQDAVALPMPEDSMQKVIYVKAYPEICRLNYLPEAAGETCNNILLAVGLGSMLLSSVFMLICVLSGLHDRLYLWSLVVVVAVVCLAVVTGLYGIGCLSMLYDITHGRPSLVEVLDEPNSDMRDLAVAYGSSSNITNTNT